MAHNEAFPGTPHEWLRAERARRPGVLPTRGVGATLLRIIREQPGVHFRALGREAGLTSSGQLRHHLDRLADLGAIAEVKDGRFSRFFAGGHEEDPRLRQRQARLSRPVPNLIARLLGDRPMSRTELRRRLGCADSTLGYHLNRLVQVGDIQRRIGPNGHEYALSDTSLAPPELPWRRPPADALLPNAAGQPVQQPGIASLPPAALPSTPTPATPITAQPQAQPQQTPAQPAELPTPTHTGPAPGNAAADPRSFLVGQ